MGNYYFLAIICYSPTLFSQLSLALISREVENNHIEQRITDGYINATALCQASNKKLGHYLENASTNLFLKELQADIGIPISDHCILICIFVVMIDLTNTLIPVELNDPFYKDKIVAVNAWSGYVMGRLCASGYIVFRDGMTEGRQEFEGANFDEVLMKLKDFLIRMR